MIRSTYAEVADKLNKATNEDQLAEAATRSSTSAAPRSATNFGGVPKRKADEFKAASNDHGERCPEAERLAGESRAIKPATSRQSARMGRSPERGK